MVLSAVETRGHESDPTMKPEGEILEEAMSLPRRVGYLEGQLAETIEHIAALEASATQGQLELDAARAAAMTAENDLAHFQRRALDREQALQRRVLDLESRLGDAQRHQREAEVERHAVIAALGRRGRRLLAAAEDPPSEPEATERTS